MKLEQRMLLSISQRAGNVVLRSELTGMGSSSQVTKALRVLQAKGVLLRIGSGVYAKTRKSSVTGAIIPAGSLETLAIETLEKLGVQVEVSSAAAAYNRGDTTQLPGRFGVNTGPRRISRKIAVGGRTVAYENNYTVRPWAKLLPVAKQTQKAQTAWSLAELGGQATDIESVPRRREDG